jgi:phage gp36-like protein
MAYCTQDDLLKLISEKELAELTTESGGVPDAAVVAEAIARAEAEIDAYLGVRYTLPLGTVPARVKVLAVDVAIYHLFTRRGIQEEVRRLRYSDALAFLRDVAAGKAQVVGLDGTEISGEAEEVTEMTSAPRVFSRDNLGEW